MGINSVLKITGWLDLIFWSAAIFATVFLGLRIIMMVFSGHGAADTDHGDLFNDTATDSAFEFFSTTTLLAFFMMFGWIGLACFKQFNLSSTLSIVYAVGAGFVSLFITGSVLKGAKKLGHSGNVFDINNSVGKNATVYIEIPADGRGVIQTNFQNDSVRQIDAISLDNEKIESFTIVQIEKVIDQGTVGVRKLK